jgi:RNA polymerase sigma-70 factor, ECF subfamily
VANAATEMVLRTPGPARDGTLPRGRPPSRAAPVVPIGVRPCRASTPDRVKFARPSTPIPHPGLPDPSAPGSSPGQDQAAKPDQGEGQHQAAQHQAAQHQAAQHQAAQHQAAQHQAAQHQAAQHEAAETSAADPAGSEVDTAAWELVAAAQQGDQNAFGQLYDRYVDVVFRFVLFRVGDRPLAEDLTSETFLRALRRISSVSYQGRDVGAWFVTIARNLVLDHVKSSRYRLEMTTADILDSSADDRGPEHEVVEEATATELMRCVAQLGRDQQECIMLRFMQGLSVSETAAMMGRNEGAVKALQHRAVRRLAQLLPEGLR